MRSGLDGAQLARIRGSDAFDVKIEQVFESLPQKFLHRVPVLVQRRHSPGRHQRSESYMNEEYCNGLRFNTWSRSTDPFVFVRQISQEFGRTARDL